MFAGVGVRRHRAADARARLRRGQGGRKAVAQRIPNASTLHRAGAAGETRKYCAAHPTQPSPATQPVRRSQPIIPTYGRASHMPHVQCTHRTAPNDPSSNNPAPASPASPHLHAHLVCFAVRPQQPCHCRTDEWAVVATLERVRGFGLARGTGGPFESMASAQSRPLEGQSCWWGGRRACTHLTSLPSHAGIGRDGCIGSWHLHHALPACCARLAFPAHTRLQYIRGTCIALASTGRHRWHRPTCQQSRVAHAPTRPPASACWVCLPALPPPLCPSAVRPTCTRRAQPPCGPPAAPAATS